MRVLQRRLLSMAFILASVCGASLFAQEKATPNLAELTLSGNKMVFKHLVALSGEAYGEPRIIVLATGQKLSADVLKQIKEINAEDGSDAEIDQPYLKLVFQENGELSSMCGKGRGSSFLKSDMPDDLKATIADGRIKGEVKYADEGDFAKTMLAKLDLPIGGSIAADQPVKLDPPVKVSVTGKFNGDGKPGNLKYLTVRERESFNGKEAISLVFTEKDPSKSKDPAFDAGFRKLGNALILSVDLTGGIFGCEVAHSAHSKGPFSAIGEIKMVEFDLSTGNVIGNVSTGGVLDAFGQKWEVDLKFAAPLPEKMRKAMSQPKPVVKETKIADEPADDDEPMPEVTKKPAKPMLAARKLALPADAKNIQFKQLVKHIAFDSGLTVERVAQEFSTKLKAQGWQEEAGGLMGKKNAILKRALGDAKLTIMIQPTGTGSQVKVFTEGLDWESGAAEDKKGSKVGAGAGADEIEKKAQDLIKKTLKDLPPGTIPPGTLPPGLLDEEE